MLIPEDPFALFKNLAQELTARAFVITHGDIHPKNLILTPSNALVLIDWEMVLVADPLYEIAVHFQRTPYLAAQEDLFLNTYLDAAGRSVEFELVKKQINIYRKLERVKSAIVDSVRYSREMKRLTLSYQAQMDLAFHYHEKLKKAWEVWNIKPGNELAKPEQTIPLLLSLE